MKKILVFGSGGLVGFKISNLIIKKRYPFFGTYNNRDPKFGSDKSIKLDVRNLKQVKEIIDDQKPDIIINSTSITNVDYCETHEQLAQQINTEFVLHLFRYCDEKNIKLVYLSTDSVFDGTKKTPYVEDDVPNPINVYGKTKLEGEKIILQNENNLVLRASVLYGWLPKFLATLNTSSMKNTNFGQWLVEELRNNDKVKIITDELSSPILADEFARTTFELAINDKSGIFHLAPNIIINRYDFSCRIAERLGFDKNKLIPILNKDLGRKVKTGYNKCLNSEKALTHGIDHFLTLDKSIDLLNFQINT